MKIFFLLLLFPLLSRSEEESEGLRALRLSCQQKVALGCYNYANMMLKRERSEEAQKYFDLGCKLEHSDSCGRKTWDSVKAIQGEGRSEVQEPESTTLDLSAIE
jgi:hypothetical protein